MLSGITINRQLAHCVLDKDQAKPTLARELLMLLGAFNIDDPYEEGRTTVAPSENDPTGEYFCAKKDDINFTYAFDVPLFVNIMEN
jgi:hypothetical protein